MVLCVRIAFVLFVERVDHECCGLRGCVEDRTKKEEEHPSRKRRSWFYQVSGFHNKYTRIYLMYTLRHRRALTNS